jgi:hypothetical protein
MDPLHATIGEFAADGFTHVQCFCPRRRMTRLMADYWLPRLASRWASPSCSFQHGSAVRSAVVNYTPSSRGAWKTCLASHWGGAGSLISLSRSFKSE